MDNTPKNEDFNKEDLLYFMNLSPEEKLDYLEKLVMGLREVTPPSSLEMSKHLRESGF